MGGDHHAAAGVGGNKRSRKASSLADDGEGETSRHRRSKICDAASAPTPGRRHAGESAAGGRAQAAAPHGDGSSAVSEEDYVYVSDGAGEKEVEYIYIGDSDDDVEEEGGVEHEQQQPPDDAADAPAAAESSLATEQRYAVLTESDLQARQDADTAAVAEVLCIPAGFAAVLLRHFKWRAGRVQEEWFADEARVRAAAGLPADPDQPLVPAVRGATALCCGVCFDEFPAGGTAAAGSCGHFYCDECWQGYVRAAVADGPRCLDLRCPEPSCAAPVVRELADEVLDGDGRARYGQFWRRSYVEESGGKLRWCGGAGCALALELVGGGDADVVCECGCGVCWSCGEEAHRPVSCATVRAWLVKNSSDSAETANWVTAHTKPCPMCARPIEKNQGCNHMRCSPPCGHHFCWLCLQPAGGANHYACNDTRRAAGMVAAGADAADGFDDDDTPPAGSAAGAGAADGWREEVARRRRARAALERYLYHYERWASNGAALESALRDTAALERRGGELERMARCADVPATELAFVGEAYREVARGRRVLRWAHAYGYFLDPDPAARGGGGAVKRALFDDLQNQANRWLECLHAAAELERKDLFGDGGGGGNGKGKGKKKEEVVPVVVVSAGEFRAYRQKVVNLTAVTRRFLGNLVRAFETDLPEVVTAANPNP